METVVERCAALDVHQASVVACVMVGSPGKAIRKEVRTFRTMTSDLENLKKWLAAEGCTHVAMESTGVYWVPVYSVLEGSFELIVGNAMHIKNVPGRKTDVKDSEWLADLCRHGLIRKSFVPPKDLRDLRDLTRYRRKLVESHTAEGNRLYRLLETANIKLGSVVSEILGVSGRLMLRAILDGTAAPAEIANLAKRRLRNKMPDLILALEGRVTEHHRFMLKMQLDRVEQAERDIAVLDKRIDEKLAPYNAHVERLKTIPGVDSICAAAMIAELGTDMRVFPTAEHAAAWAGVAPGNNESAGKRKREAARKGNVHLTTALVHAAVCASRKKGSYLKDKYWRLKARRGPKRAALAIAHKILVGAYYMLRDQTDWSDLGEPYLDRLNSKAIRNSLVHRLEQLGYDVTLAPRQMPALSAQAV